MGPAVLDEENKTLGPRIFRLWRVYSGGAQPRHLSGAPRARLVSGRDVIRRVHIWRRGRSS